MKNLFTTNFNHYKNKSGIYQLSIFNRRYIGSSKNIYDRLKTHRNSLRKEKHDNNFLQNCINKYGQHNCFVEILEFCKESDLLEKEQWYINNFKPELNLVYEVVRNTPLVGYRANEKKVYRYTLNGEFIDEFISARECGRVLNISSRDISHAANILKTDVNSCSGYMFSYEKKEKLTPYTNNSSKAKIKSITMYTLEGVKIKRFESIADAARFVQNETSKTFESLCATISSIALGKGIMLENKYRFSHDNIEKLSILIPKKNLPILQIDCNGKETIWKSVVEAANTLNISALGIRKVLRKERKKYNHCIWKFYMV